MSDPAGLVRDWTYMPSRVAPRVQSSRLLRSLLLRRTAPAHRVLAAATPVPRWSVYFAFLPDGVATPAHLFTLDRLAAEPGRLLVICATPTPGEIPAAIRDRADALLWKALPGFDFSAYGLALRHLAERSPGADVFVMNDSVFGPFASPAATLADAPWDFAGFTASSLFENHVQSYAFQLRGLTPDRFAALALPRYTAFNRYMDVVLCQETRLARRAARDMSVGARWFAPVERSLNLSLNNGTWLAGQGVPFLKRSLLGKFGHFVGAGPSPVSILEANRHPVEADAA